ncbi:MAG TPA: DUF4880 domain-containing protein, partial [Bordetella sp.]
MHCASSTERAVLGGGAEDIPARVVDAAVAWAVKLNYNEPDAATRQEFEHWLQAGPLHRAAWQRLQALRDEMHAVPPSLALDTLRAKDMRRIASRRR